MQIQAFGSLFLDIIQTLFRDYHLSYFISILRHFCTVLRVFFAALFSLSSFVLQNMLQLSFLNCSVWFTGCFFQTKSPTFRWAFSFSICYIQSVDQVGYEGNVIHQFIAYFATFIQLVQFLNDFCSSVIYCSVDFTTCLDIYRPGQ